EVPAPGLILVTHAHPDHAWGLKEGAPCPVYASAETWDIIGNYPVADRRVAVPGEPLSWRGFTIESFPVVHSLRAPANGYRVSAGARSFFYIPDVVYIEDRRRALGGCDLYIGDGATIKRSFVRRRGDLLFGHTPISTQLTWCHKEGVPRAVITHCGTQIVEEDAEAVDFVVGRLAEERGVSATVATDGMELVLR
ncbi:MAG: MBL fold metallo-hydrolase, partial [Pseudomonadota bacterium]